MRNDVTDNIARELRRMELSARSKNMSFAQFLAWLVKKLGDRMVGEPTTSKRGVSIHFFSKENEVCHAYYDIHSARWGCKF